MKKENPITIAVVDDNALIRESVKFRLKSSGYNVIIEAENGQEFLDKLQKSNTPDICVLDINMPVMDGLETTIHLKKEWPAMKIIFFSMATDDPRAFRITSPWTWPFDVRWGRIFTLVR